MRWAAARVVANAGPATGGDAFASYRLTRALDALSNCRTPFSVSLARTPAPLLRARRLSLAACAAFFTATEHVVAGINASDMAATRSGVAGVRAGLVLLKRAERVLEREARPA
jgi:hypothetical protein